MVVGRHDERACRLWGPLHHIRLLTVHCTSSMKYQYEVSPLVPGSTRLVLYRYDVKVRVYCSPMCYRYNLNKSSRGLLVTRILVYETVPSH